MGNYEQLSLIALAIASITSLIAFMVAGKILPHSPWLQAVGRKLHQQKMDMLSKPPLSYYQRAAERGDFWAGLLIIATAILLKSVVSGLVGLITIFYLPLGVGTIPALAAEHGDDAGLHRWVAQVTAWQASSHILAASLGFAATWLWIRTGANPLELVTGAPLFSGIVISGSLVTGLIAAWLETAGHIKGGFLKPGK